MIKKNTKQTIKFMIFSLIYTIMILSITFKFIPIDESIIVFAIIDFAFSFMLVSSIDAIVKNINVKINKVCLFESIDALIMINTFAIALVSDLQKEIKQILYIVFVITFILFIILSIKWEKMKNNN